MGKWEGKILDGELALVYWFLLDYRFLDGESACKFRTAAA